MNKWGNSYEQDGQTIKIAQSINSQSNAFELLQMDNFVEKVKGKSSKITKKIVQPQQLRLLLQFIQIAINPQRFMEKQSKVLDKKMTHGAIQVLTNLSEEFIEAVFDQQEVQEDEVIQVEKEYPILVEIFRTVTPQVEETGFAYLCKIITPFIYQRPEEMLKFFSKPMIKILVDFLWSQSIAEIVTKILEAEGENDFFEKEKLQFFRTFCQQVSQIDDQCKFQRIIQNFGIVLDSLVQKHEDRIQRSKYASLTKNIIEETSNFKFIVRQLQKYGHNHTIKTELLNILYLYLRIHEPAKQGSKLYDQESKQSETIILNQQFLDEVKMFFMSHQVAQFISEKRRQLLQYYKAINMLITLKSAMAEQLLSKQFLNITIKLMRDDPHNNILHNFQKDVVVSGIKESAKICQIVQNQIGFDYILRSNLSEINSKISFQTQIFLIGQAVKAKADETSTKSELWGDLEKTLAKKRKFYSAVIGGNPRNSSQRWDNFQNEMILKPLEEKKEEKKGENAAEKPKSKQKHQYTMVTKLDELEGTEVLSEQEEDDPFCQKNRTNSHYIDDVGMPDLPLDSDRSEEGEAKNLQNQSDQMPELLMDSGLHHKEKNLIDDLPQTLNQNQLVQNGSPNSKNGESKLPGRGNSILAIDLDNIEVLQSKSASNQNSNESPFYKSNKQDCQQMKIESVKKPNQLAIIENSVNELTTCEQMDLLIGLKYNLSLTK